MGVPDFLKFAARTSPTAFCRIPKGGTGAPLCFDFVLVDATNVLQTVGLEKLAGFLKQPQLLVRWAVIFALDAQRHRAGTSRSHRTSSSVIDVDVTIQQLCNELQYHYKQRCRDEHRPQVVLSGRHVSGEADYKILDIQRHLVMQSLISGVEIPTFCFISEDSDVLCGALCGPAPHTVSIATTLHDTMFEMCVLRLTHVLAHIAQCVDALGGNTESDLEKDAVTNICCNENKKKEQKEDEGAVFYRKKRDGPMVATGNCVVLSNTDSDESDDEKPEEDNQPLLPVVSSYTLEAAEILHNSSVDLVLLFIIVMGNGCNVPPVIRGATKVDIQSCWNAYCRMKYTTASCDREKKMGRSLLCLYDVDVVQSECKFRDIASVTVDCFFLRDILESAHYADANSRPPVEEEKERALLFFSQAVYTAFRYIVACNIYSNIDVNDTFLDARQLLETEVAAPNFDAFLWVLGLTRRRTLCFPLVGIATANVMCGAAQGSSAVEAAVVAERSCGSRVNKNVVLYGDVCNTLLAPGSGIPHLVKLQSFFPAKTLSVSNDIRSCINEYFNSLVKTNNNNKAEVSHGHKSEFFLRLVVAWQSSMAFFVPFLKGIINTNSSFFMAASNNNIFNNDTVKSDLAECVFLEPEKKLKMSYSFELRRMAPVLVDEGKKHCSFNVSAANTAMNASLLKALRVSYDYAQSTAAIQPLLEGTVTQPTPLKGKRKKGAETTAQGVESVAKRLKSENATVSLGKRGKNGSQEAKHQVPDKKKYQKMAMN